MVSIFFGPEQDSRDCGVSVIFHTWPDKEQGVGITIPPEQRTSFRPSFITSFDMQIRDDFDWSESGNRIEVGNLLNDDLVWYSTYSSSLIYNSFRAYGKEGRIRRKGVPMDQLPIRSLGTTLLLMMGSGSF